MSNILSKTPTVIVACRVKNLDPALVRGVRLTEADVFLQTADLGEVRVERSALPASLQVEAEQPPQALLIRDVPSNTLAALVSAGYMTLATVAGASDKALLAVDGVGRATLRRIRAAIIDAATAVDVDE